MIPNISGLVKKTDYDAKITEIEGKIPDVGNLATKNVLTTVENKIPDASKFATKTALTTLENKIPDVSSLVKRNTRVAETDTKVSSLDVKIAKNKTKNVSIFFRQVCSLMDQMVFKLI